MRPAPSPPQAPVEPKRSAEQRDRELAASFAGLGPGQLDELSGVWRLCAGDLYGLALWRTNSVRDAEDALQETFIRLAQAAESGRLRDVRKPFPYLLRMAHSAAVDTLRQRQRHRGEQLSEVPELVEAVAERAAEAGRLSRHLAALPQGQRSVVYLRHFCELSFREIGAVLGLPTFTAASRYRLALGRLRRALGVHA